MSCVLENLSPPVLNLVWKSELEMIFLSWMNLASCSAKNPKGPKRRISQIEMVLEDGGKGGLV